MNLFKMDVAEIIDSDFVLKDGRRACKQRILDHRKGRRIDVGDFDFGEELKPWIALCGDKVF